MTLTCCGTAASWDADALPPAVCTRLRGLFGLDSVPDTLSEAVAAVETDTDTAVDAATDAGAGAGTEDDSTADAGLTVTWDAHGADPTVASDCGRDDDAPATPASTKTNGTACPFGAAGLVDAPSDDPAAVDGDHRVVVRERNRAVALPTFADALAVATLIATGATVETVDPLSGGSIAIRVDEAGEIDPAGTDAAVVTLGVGPSVWSGAAPTRTDVRAEIGPYVHAFAARRTARRWESASEDPVAALEPGPAASLGRLLIGGVRDPAAEVAWHVPDQVSALRRSRIGANGAGATRSAAPRRVDE